MKASPRILFVGNFLIRHWGAGRTGIDMRLAAGALRNGWQVLSFSERDITRLLAPLGFLRTIGARMMNARLVETARNWKPDIIILGHCDYTTNATLDEIHRLLPGVRIVHVNCDSPTQAHTWAQLQRRVASCDAIFSTTAGHLLDQLKTARNVVGFFPNPSDPSFEVEDNSQKTDFAYDVFFAGRPSQADARHALLEDFLRQVDPSVRRGFFGMGLPLVLGRAYEEALAVSKMGLSLNRFEGEKWYASDRLTHLMGNGLLTFLHDTGQMQDFFSSDEAVYFQSGADLAEKVNFYNTHDAARQAVAAAGREKYHRLFNAARVIKYLVECACGEAFSEPYEWVAEVRR